MPDLTRFLIELKFNNSKGWFDGHRERYQALRAEFTGFVAEVIGQIAVFDPGVADVQAKDTLFRINRDTRFAHDKSPYKTSFSAAIAPGGRHSTSPLYYLQLGADTSFVAGGLYFPLPPDLANIRAFIQRWPARAEALLSDPILQGHFGGLSRDGVLKRFPRGFGEGSDLLKFKSFTVDAQIDAAAEQDLLTFVVRQCRAMQPLHAWLREALSYRAS